MCRRDKANESVLSQRLGALGSARSWAPNVLAELERFIRSADDYDLFRVNPIQYSSLVGLSEAGVDEDDLPDRGGGQRGSVPSVRRLLADNASPDGDQSPAATRITFRPHDPGTGEEIEKREVVKGYEYSRGQFLTFTAEELNSI